MKQFLCSHLIVLRRGEWETGGNLERIWAEGATVNAEDPIPPGARVVMSTSACDLPGTVISCDSDPLGNFLDIAFETEWTLNAFTPDHLMDPNRGTLA